MSESGNESKLSVYPTLRYRDAPAAIEWLCTAFGFQQHLVMPNPDGTIAHAELRLGNGMIMLGSRKDEDTGELQSQTESSALRGIYVYVADADAQYERARAAGGEVVREINDTEYGSREYAIRDPEGTIWSFGTYAGA